MTTARWQRLQEIVERALERPADERMALVHEMCGEDGDLERQAAEMLVSYESAGDFLEDTVQAAAHEMLEEAQVGVGDRIGPYHVERVLGEGGMGAVYLATRADDQFRKQVAIKVIRTQMALDSELLARFRAERQILANLTHPNIARLLDGGITTSGRPYLVMEFVDGEPLDRYVQTKSLSVRERILLVRDLCAAVQYAHQNLIVHRDIKPANVLVSSDGVPMLVDFGIAKVLNPEVTGQTAIFTRAAERLMTPEYASPEQIRGEMITTATDVYALGVLLYEILAGDRPFNIANLTAAQVERLICETAVEPPSTIRGRAGRSIEPISEELDKIVLNAMHKEPARRYASASELSEDLRRYLEGLPVMAKPDSWRYRAAKFVRRHRIGVAAAVLFVLTIAALSTGLAIAARRARREARTSEQVANFLISLFKNSRPDEAQGRALTARDILDRGAERIDRELSSEPMVQSRLLDTLGTVYFTLGAFDRAEPLVKRAVDLRTRLLGKDSLDTAESIHMLGQLAWQRGDLPRAADLYRQSLETFRQKAGENSLDTATIIANLGLVLTEMGDFAEAANDEREAIAVKSKIAGPESRSTLSSKHNLEYVLAEAGNYVEAEPLAREVLEARVRTLGPDNPDVGYSLNNLAFLLWKTSRYDEALKYAHKTIDLRIKLFGQNHPDVGQAYGLLALILADLARWDEAKEFAGKSLEIRARLQGPMSLGAAFSHDVVGIVALRSGDVEHASTEFAETLDVRRTKLRATHPDLAASYDHVGLVDLARGDLGAAQVNLTKAFDIRRQFFGPDHEAVAESEMHLGRLLAAQFDAVASEARYRDALRIARAKLPAKHRLTADILTAWGELIKHNRTSEARAMLEEALTIRRAIFPPGHVDTAATEALLTQLTR